MLGRKDVRGRGRLRPFFNLEQLSTVASPEAAFLFVTAHAKHTARADRAEQRAAHPHCPAAMIFPKIGIQGYSLGSLHLLSEEFVWTSADKSRYGKRFQPPFTICREVWAETANSLPRPPDRHCPDLLTLTSTPTLVVLFSSKKVKWVDASHATWAQFGDYCHLRLFMKNGMSPVRLDGFSKSQYPGAKLANYSSTH